MKGPVLTASCSSTDLEAFEMLGVGALQLAPDHADGEGQSQHTEEARDAGQGTACVRGGDQVAVPHYT